jgi:hypothetical protein
VELDNHTRCLTQIQLLKAFVQGEIVFIKGNLRYTDEAAFELAVGDHAFASRKVTPLNEEGGVAIVTGRRIAQRNAVYDIKILLTKNVEKDIAAEGVIVKYDARKQKLRHSSKTTSGERCITFSCSDVLSNFI